MCVRLWNSHSGITPWLSGVNKAHSCTGRKNQSTSVNLSQAGDQIEKWIARRTRGVNLHCGQGAIRLSTCLVHDNGHRCGLAKCAANEDEITILAREAGDNKQVCRGSRRCLMSSREGTWQYNSLIITVCFQGPFSDRQQFKILLRWFLIYHPQMVKSNLHNRNTSDKNAI